VVAVSLKHKQHIRKTVGTHPAPAKATRDG
jgi:hypothetical protein